MIARTHRFHGYGSLRFVYQKGTTLRGPLWSLKYVRNNQRRSYRLAVVVSKKVHKSAVVRNRIRRRIYEAVRLQEAHINGSYDIVCSVFSDQVASLPNQQLTDKIIQQLEAAGIISKNSKGS